MIVQFNKITPNHRDVVRKMEAKAYIGYIRYLLIKRWSFERVRKELMRLGLAWDEKRDFEIYFQEVLYPIIRKYKIQQYYKLYRFGLSDEMLTMRTFKGNEMERITFIEMIKKLEIEQFFAEEIIHHYGGSHNLPNHPETGEKILSDEQPVDLVEILQNEKRYVIEQLLVEGYSPQQITDHLERRYDIEMSPEQINVYAKSFFDVKKQDVTRLLDSLHTEKETLENHLMELKSKAPGEVSIGERFEIVSNISDKINRISTMIKKLSSVHTGAAFNSAVLDVTDMREMFKDVMVRSHKRFRDMDERTEDDIISPLNTIVAMMAKATDKILSIEEVLSQKTTKSINEEMLEVITPTLDRIEQEEREAMFAYRQSNSKEEDDDDIIGFE